MAAAPPTAPRQTLAAVTLPLGSVAALATGGVLGNYALTMAGGLSPATSVDTVVALLVAIVGALVAAWAALHLATASLCLAAAACGRRWRAGERLVTEHGPAIVRRGLAAAIGVSLGVGGLTAASASPDHSPPAHTFGAVAADHAPHDEDVLDLGWRPTPDLSLVTDTDGDVHVETSLPEPEDDLARPDDASDELVDPQGSDDDGAGHDDARHDDAGHDDATTAPPRDDAHDDDGAVDRETTDDGARDAARERSDQADTAPDTDERAAGDTDRHTQRAPRSYVIAPGDSLWSITDRLLGGATDSRVASAWPELYEANRDVVGGDPDLIHAGQELAVPATFEELS